MSMSREEANFEKAIDDRRIIQCEVCACWALTNTVQACVECAAVICQECYDKNERCLYCQEATE